MSDTISTEPNLTPTQHLILELLSARDRLEDRWWPLPTSLSAAAESLVELGLIQTMHGFVEKTFRADITDAGRLHCGREGVGTGDLPEPQDIAFDLIQSALARAQTEQAQIDPNCNRAIFLAGVISAQTSALVDVSWTFSPDPRARKRAHSRWRRVVERRGSAGSETPVGSGVRAGSAIPTLTTGAEN
ncbi:MAG: hypothetical protein WKF57_05970 [Nakamurella sp.]